MKKILSLTFIFTFILLNVLSSQVSAQDVHPSRSQVRQQFEQRLNLTDKQKKKAKTIHEKSIEEMKPVMSEIDSLRKELKSYKNNSDLDEKTKKEKIDTCVEKLKNLNKKAREIRKQNSKEFEKILNKKQKAELEKMKAEGRAKFEKKHPSRPPFNMFGAPNFWNKKPFLAPQNE